VAAQKEVDSVPGLGGLYVKAVAGTTVKPVLKRVPGIGGRFGGGTPRLPATELVLRGAEVDRRHLADYDRVCGFSLRDELPVTYPHMLAFPLSMQLMTDASFPFPVIGLVHIRNRIEQVRPIRDDEKLTVRVRVDDLEPHPKGKQFHVLAEAEVGSETVWRSDSTYLRKGGGSGEQGAGSREQEGPEPADPSAVWDVPSDIGRRYAKVSGDSNPIHLRRSTAMAMGMSRPIAHGMWTKARCLAALEGELPESFAVDVAFKLPVQLPAKVAFRTWEEGVTREFSLRDHKSGKPHVTGVIERG
jgi:acyl dehydratase